MPYNGSGVFNRLYSWVNDAAANIKIRADRMDNEMNGFATGLSNCITKDGQTTITANLPMANFRHTSVGNAASRTDYAAFGQVQDGKAAWVDGGGTADAITAAYSIPITALVDGQLCYVRATAANATTTPTFSPNGLTARTIVKNGGQALVAGDISGDGHELELRYDLANTRWELMNPRSQSVPFTSASSATSAYLDFAEDTDNGTNRVRLIAPASIAADVSVTLPGTADTLVGRDTTDTLTNKTLTSPVIDNRITGTVTGLQSQSISASVASNALTISASALSLEFRSATLGSGTITRVSGTPANLVISSGSTLGTVNAVQSRIAVLAINNAGTIELAAVNIAGGNDLSETGLISTTAEGGAGGADSNNVIYSTTARTNVSYRVIGYIESTQATAGTWATAPSTIQGAGGNALTSMSSLGYGQTWQNVVGSRALGTTYYNTTGNPILIHVAAFITTSSSQTTITVNGITAGSGATLINQPAAGASAIVPAGGSYSASNSGVSPSLTIWSELR